MRRPRARRRWPAAATVLRRAVILLGMPGPVRTAAFQGTTTLHLTRAFRGTATPHWTRAFRAAPEPWVTAAVRRTGLQLRAMSSRPEIPLREALRAPEPGRFRGLPGKAAAADWNRGTATFRPASPARPAPAMRCGRRTGPRGDQAGACRAWLRRCSGRSADGSHRERSHGRRSAGPRSSLGDASRRPPPTNRTAAIAQQPRSRRRREPGRVLRGHGRG